MSFTQLTYDVDGPAAIITLNRPDQLDAFTATMLEEVQVHQWSRVGLRAVWRASASASPVEREQEDERPEALAHEELGRALLIYCAFESAWGPRRRDSTISSSGSYQSRIQGRGRSDR